LDQPENSKQKLCVGDYVRWPIGVAVFSATADGVVKPAVIHYSYGIVVDLAPGEVPYTDVLIIYCGPGKKYNWIVCHADDDEYEFEIVSPGANHEKS
jgi:hypothetical protein